MQRRPAALYAAFDRFPSRKGAAIHIGRFAQALFDHAGGGLLYVLGGEDLEAHQVDGEIETVRFSAVVPNFLERTMAFGRRLESLLDECGDSLTLCHFRDPWSGLPILSRAHSYRTLFEVNALPSIELPFLFPDLGADTLSKIRELELFCLREADAIVVPSATIGKLLLGLGVEPRKLVCIPNGADLYEKPPRPIDAPETYIIYFGALQAWQGVDTLLRAMARLADLDVSLVICASVRGAASKQLQKFAQKLGVEDGVHWMFSLKEEDLRPWITHAALSIAPLKDCSRNVVQGCSPLKILESMAAGVPVIASDLPPVRELITDSVDGRLFAPDRPAELARAIRVLLDYPDERRRLGVAARARISESFTWECALRSLHDVYDSLSVASGNMNRDRNQATPAIVEVRS